MNSWLTTPTVRPDFSGRVVLITGGGAGIGRCLTLSYAQAGAQVYFVDQSSKAGEETLEILKAQQLTASFWKMDVSDAAAREKWVAELLAESSGRLDVLINNAAIANAHQANLFCEEADAFERVIAVNLAAPFHLTRLFREALITAQGCVINIASTRAFMSEPDSEGYAASKGGIISLTHAMAASFAGHRVRVNSVSPGWIDTTEWQVGSPAAINWPKEEHAQHPAGRIGIPADIAASCFFLSGPDSGFITGQNIMIDGGMTKKMIYR